MAPCPAAAAASDERLSRMAGFRITARCVALDAVQQHEPEKCFLGEPALRTLRAKATHQQPHLAARIGARERNEQIGSAEIAVEFRDLVFENPVITERVPG